MEPRQTNFRDRLARGEEGEKEVASALIDKGWDALPLYQFAPNETPLIISQSCDFVAPDLTLFKEGRCIFVEVKAKSKWIKHKGTVETGCDYRLYSKYLQISKKTKIPLWLFFTHSVDPPVGMYCVNINKRGRYWDGLVNGERVFPAMYFWNKNQLTKFKPPQNRQP